jgi:phage gp29-like protein
MLLDQFGREIKSNKPILEEVAVQTVRDRYGSYPSQGLTPQRLATIFKEADQGDVMRQAELFEEMEEKDLHLGGIMQTRKLAVTGLDWEVLPASDSAEDKKIAAAAKEMLEYIENLEDALLDTLDAVGKGFAVQEIIWDMSEGQVWAKELKWVHQRRFTFNAPFAALLETPRLLTEAEQTWGEELLPNKFIYHRYRARSGATSRGGLYRPCAYMYLFKNYDIKDWLVFNELFSVPMRVGKYKPGAGNEEKEALKRAVFNLGVDAAAVVSDNTIIELIESKRTGDAGIFSQLAEFCDKAMSKSVLGHTGSAEGTPGKLGGEDQATDVRQDLLEADAKGLMRTGKFQLLKPWVGYNYGPDKGVPIWKLHFENEEDLEKTARVYGVLVKDAGFEGIPEDHVHERFGIPKAKPGEKTLRAVQVFPSGPDLSAVRRVGEAAQANKRLAMMINAGGGETDWVKRYMERLAPALQDVRTSALDGIEAYLRSLPAPPPQEQFIAQVQGILGASFADLDQAAVSGMVGEIYQAYRATPGMDLVLGGPDTRAIDFLAKLDNLHVSSYLRNSDAQAVIKNFLTERYLDQGAGLFGRGKPEDVQAFKDLFGQKLADMQGWQVERILDTSVQRIRNWAGVSQLEEAGIAEIEIYEPTMDCDFCAAMNGRVISVPIAYRRMTEQAAMSPEEYIADLQATPATLGNLDDIIESGMLPPYHPHCHGRALKRVK